MIKMIASDLDGTLLNSKKELPRQFPEMVRRLREKGISFVAASGRARRSLSSLFEGIPVAMVANNGGTAYDDRGERIFTGDFSYEKAKTVLDVAAKYPFMYPIITGTQDIYLQEDCPENIKKFVFFYLKNQVSIVPDNLKVFEQEPVIQISVYTGEDGSHEDEALSIMKKASPHFHATLSGEGWLDILRADVDKGSTLLTLARHYGIAPDEIMVFGDYINDYEFLQASPNSYAMKNAHPRIKEVCSHVLAYSNEECGVLRELDSRFDLKLDL